MAGSLPPIPEIQSIDSRLPAKGPEIATNQISIAGVKIREFSYWELLASERASCGETAGFSQTVSLGTTRTEAAEIGTALKAVSPLISPELSAKLSSTYSLSRQTEKQIQYTATAPACQTCRLAYWQLVDRVEI